MSKSTISPAAKIKPLLVWKALFTTINPLLFNLISESFNQFGAIAFVDRIHLSIFNVFLSDIIILLCLTSKTSVFSIMSMLTFLRAFLEVCFVCFGNELNKPFLPVIIVIFKCGLSII